MSDVALAGLLGAIGALIGILISQLLEIVRQNRGFATRQKEKIIDKRIDAHEAIISLSETMMTVVMPDKITNFPKEIEKPIRGIGVLNSLELFENWWADMYVNCYRKHMWLSPQCLKELNYVQDYIVNLRIILANLNDEEIKRLSVLVRPDFITMSGNLRHEAVKYLYKDAVSFKLKDLNGYHKYKRSVSEKRLNETRLIKEYGSYLNNS